MYAIRHCFICRSSDSTVSEDAGIDPELLRVFLRLRHWKSDTRSPPVLRKVVNADGKSQISSRYYHSFCKFFAKINIIFMLLNNYNFPFIGYKVEADNTKHISHR